MPKTSKTQPKQKPKQQNAVKHHIVSFRMTDAQYARLETTCKESGVLGASTPRQFARKLVCDYLSGKIKYKNAEDLRMDLETYKT